MTSRAARRLHLLEIAPVPAPAPGPAPWRGRLGTGATLALAPAAVLLATPLLAALLLLLLATAPAWVLWLLRLARRRARGERPVARRRWGPRRGRLRLVPAPADAAPAQG